MKAPAGRSRAALNGRAFGFRLTPTETQGGISRAVLGSYTLPTIERCLVLAVHVWTLLE